MPGLDIGHQQATRQVEHLAGHGAHLSIYIYVERRLRRDDTPYQLRQHQSRKKARKSAGERLRHSLRLYFLPPDFVLALAEPAIFFNSSRDSAKCRSTGCGNEACAARNTSYSASALLKAVSCEIVPAWVRIFRSLMRMKSSSLRIQSAIYIGVRPTACSSAKSRYAETIRFKALISSSIR